MAAASTVPRLMAMMTALLAALAPLASEGGADAHADRMARSRALFVSDVRAALIENCVECHGGAEVRSRFDLTTREGLLAGGEIGVAVVPGRSEQSPLIAYLAQREEPFMPLERPPLSEETILKLARWIDLGAAYDRPLVDRAARDRAPLRVTDADRRYWAFAPLQESFPAGAGIDVFVRREHRRMSLTAAPPASGATLARRLHFDVTGLPPDPASIDAFVADRSAGAYEALVDRLLASPRFGERWARHWLDVARFAESHGFEHDYDRRFAFHFRDFVIRAFNEDMPYDRFVRWQLAGDQLAPDNPLALMATGFLAAGVHPTQVTVSDAERVRYDSMDDMLATTGTAMLGVTIGCARCHDHKHDPVPTRDYYRMLSAFTTTVRAEVDVDLGPLGIEAPTRGGKRLLQTIMVSGEAERVTPWRPHVSNEQIPDFYRETHFLARGDTGQKAGVADLGFLQVLTRAADETRWMDATGGRTRGGRAALSRWITDVEAGAGHLLARVMVNRLWHHYFGRGIVGTPNDFGAQGDRPTHPELLDWLAQELIRNGWRLKPIHKLILMSDTYRMGGLASAGNESADPENRFLWRRAPRRLEAEAIRDNALAVAGLLDETMFGAGTLDETTRRRSIYFTVKRSRLVPTMQSFDWPDTLTSTERRAVTTTASQALVFINDPHFRAMAAGFAARIREEEDWTGRAYAIAYGRPPSERERALAEEFAGRQLESNHADVDRTLTDFCGALMSANEFIYID
jgi:hypothetical protein